MSKTGRRAAIYARVSTDHQSVENQIRELTQVAERRGWEIVQVYTDAGISGAKGRAQRPGLDEMLKDASRRKFDIVMSWAIDRLGRSLIDLLGTIQHLEMVGVDLYLDQQSIDTTTPMGKLVFQVTGAFAEFERSMIQQTVERLKPLVRAEKTWVITNQYLAQEIADQLVGVPAAQIVQEPVSRNTAPACGLAAFLIERQNPDALAVITSDPCPLKKPAHKFVWRRASHQPATTETVSEAVEL